MRRIRTQYEYDPEMDSRTWRKCWKPCPPSELPQWIQEQGRHRSGVKARAAAAKRRATRATHRERREEAERNLAETLRRAVQALEMGMANLKEIGLPLGEFHKCVNQHQLHNALFFLKTKCGVTFEKSTNEYAEKIKVDLVHCRPNYETEYERRKRLEREEIEGLIDEES